MKKHFIHQFVLVAFGVVTVLLPHILFAQVGAVNGACGAQYPAWFSHNPEIPYCWRNTEHLWFGEHDNAEEMCDNSADWTTVFEDNFDGSTVDVSKWNICGVGNGYYRNDEGNYCFGCDGMDNYQVTNGILRIKIEDKGISVHNPDWDSTKPLERVHQFTSGQLFSKQMFTTGRYEARVRFSNISHINYAPLWLLSDGTRKPVYFESNGDFYVDQPYKQEMDFEFGLHDNKTTCLPSMTYFHQQPNHVDINGNTIWNEQDDAIHTHTATSCIDGETPSCSSNLCYADDQWHILELVWNDYNIRWYIDGLLLREVARTYDLGGAYSISECTGPNDPWNPQQVAGSWYKRNPMMPTSPNMKIYLDAAPKNSLTSIPGGVTYLDIDYVKYQKKINCDKVLNLCEYKQVATTDPPDRNNDDPTVFTGGTINVAGNGCIFHVQKTGGFNKHVDMFASKEINLNPGFIATPDAYDGGPNTFSAQIVPCNVQSNKQDFTDPYAHDPSLETNAIELNKSKVIENMDDIPAQFEKGKTYLNLRPNPANRMVTVTFVLPLSTYVQIDLKDMNGRLVMKIDEGDYMNAAHRITVPIEQLQSGVYFVQMKAGEYIETQKLVVTH